MINNFYSDIFQINSSDLKTYDVFNGFINKDSLYYIVPSEFENIKITEFKNSYSKYKLFFENIIKILDNSNANDRLYRQVKNYLDCMK